MIFFWHVLCDKVSLSWKANFLEDVDIGKKVYLSNKAYSCEKKL